MASSPKGTTVGAPVAVTGVGVVTSLGIGIADNWRKLTAGQSGIRRISRFPTDALRTTIAGTVDFVPGYKGGTPPYAVTAAGQTIQGRDPQSDTCLQISGGAVKFSNDTTDTAFLYGDSSCAGGWALVGVGATWDAPTGVQAVAVRFGSTAAAGKMRVGAPG